jgi:hypothetical protein
MVDQTGDTEPQYKWQNPKPQFEVGRVLGRTFTAIKNNWVKFSLLSIVVAGIPMFFVALLPFFISGTEGMMSGGEFSDAALIGTVTGSILGFVAYILFSILLQSVLVHACFKDFAGEAVSLRASFAVALKFLFPVLGMMILLMFGVMIGFILLIIPGILLLLGWYIAIPVLLVEKRGVTESLGRSWELSKGYKRWILLIVVILTVISMILSTVLSLFAMPFGDVNTAPLLGGSVMFWLVYAAASGIAQALAVMINASAVAAMYYEIRDLREGITPMSIASVFD